MRRGRGAHDLGRVEMLRISGMSSSSIENMVHLIMYERDPIDRYIYILYVYIYMHYIYIYICTYVLHLAHTHTYISIYIYIFHIQTIHVFYQLT